MTDRKMTLAARMKKIKFAKAAVMQIAFMLGMVLFGSSALAQSAATFTDQASYDTATSSLDGPSTVEDFASVTTNFLATTASGSPDTWNGFSVYAVDPPASFGATGYCPQLSDPFGSSPTNCTGYNSSAPNLPGLVASVSPTGGIDMTFPPGVTAFAFDFVDWNDGDQRSAFDIVLSDGSRIPVVGPTNPANAPPAFFGVKIDDASIESGLSISRMEWRGLPTYPSGEFVGIWNVRTQTVLASVSLTKSFGTASYVSGTQYSVPMQLILKNTGNYELDNLQVTDPIDLSGNLGSAFVGLDGPISFSVSDGPMGMTNAVAPTAAVPAFNGSTQTDFLSGSDGVLGITDTLTINVNILVDASLLTTASSNSASATGTDPFSGAVNDASGGDEESDDPTPLSIPPRAVDDTSTGNMSGTSVDLDILNNDVDNTYPLDPSSVSLITPAGATGIQTDANGDVIGFTVPGEGTWTVDEATGEVTFSPQTGFNSDPTPVNYVVDTIEGEPSNEATITIEYDVDPRHTFMCGPNTARASWPTTTVTNGGPAVSTIADAAGGTIVETTLSNFVGTASGSQMELTADSIRLLDYPPYPGPTVRLSTITDQTVRIGYDGNNTSGDGGQVSAANQSEVTTYTANSSSPVTWTVIGSSNANYTISGNTITITGSSNSGMGGNRPFMGYTIETTGDVSSIDVTHGTPAGAGLAGLNSMRFAACIATNEPPVATDDLSTGNTVGSTVSVDITDNDTDTDGTIDDTSVSFVTPTGATDVLTDADGDVIGFTVPGEGTWSLDETTGLVMFVPQANFIGFPTPVDYTVRDDSGATSNAATITIEYEGLTLTTASCGPTTGVIYNALSFTSIDPAGVITSDYRLPNAGIVGGVAVDVLVTLSPAPNPGNGSDVPRVTSAGTFQFNDGPNGSTTAANVRIVERGTTTPVSGNFILQLGDVDANENVSVVQAEVSEVFVNDPSNLLITQSGGILTAAATPAFRPTVAEDTFQFAIVGRSDFQYTARSSGGNSGFNLIGNLSAPFTAPACPEPGLQVVKSIASIADTNGSGVTGDAGDTITYDFTVTNTGDTSLDAITIDDPVLGLTDAAVTPAAIAPGDMATLTGQAYIITAADQGRGFTSNTATATGTPVATDASGDPVVGVPLLDSTGTALPDASDVSDTGTEPDLDGTDTPVDVATDPETTDTDGTSGNDGDEPTVLNLPAPMASIAVVKSVSSFSDENGSMTLDAGDTVTFTFTAENTGDTSLANVTVTDTGLTPITLAPDAGFDGDLAPGETATIASATYVLTPTDISNGEIENTATGSGDPVATSPSGDPDPSTPLVDASGDPLPSVTDTSDSGSEPEIDPTTGLPTPVGTPETEETETVSGTPDSDPTNDPTSLGLPTPSVSVQKSVASYVDTNGNGVMDAGDTLNFAFRVENTGNTDLTNVTVTDSLPTAVISGSPIASLAIGAVDTSITASYVLLDADIAAGGVQNTAQASGIAVDPDGNPYGDPFDPGNPLTTTDTSDSGTDPDGNTLADPEVTETPDLDEMTDSDPTSDPTVFQITPAPSLTIQKSIASVVDVNTNGVLDAGDQVNYSFVVTNTGNVALIDVTVTDALVAVSGGPISLGIGDNDTTSFTAMYTLQPADITAGGVENTAQVDGTAADTDGNAIIDPISGQPITANDDSDSGTEPLLDATGAPIEQTDADTTDTPDLAGTTDGTTDNDPTVLFIPNPDMSVVKSVSVVLDNNIPGGDGLFGGEGDEIVYAFTVTNTGNVDLTGITITDMTVPVTGGPIDLAVGAGDSVTFTATYVVLAADIARGYIENTASGSGNAVDGDGDPIYGPTGTPLTATDTSDSGTDPDAETVTDPTNTETPDGIGGTDGDPTNDPTVTSVPGNAQPDLTVIKSVSSVVDTTNDGVIGAGDTVNYSFTVTNTGNVRLADVTVTDALATVSGGPIILEVGDNDTTTFTASAIISAAQAAAGAIENTAIASGGAVNSVGDPIRDPDTGEQLETSSTSDAGTAPEIGTSGTPTTYTDPLGNETPDATGGTDTDPTNDPTVLFLPAPSMSVVKSVASVADTNGNGFTDPGDTISYSFAVTNTGNTDLIDITITDALPGIMVTGNPIASLLQGDTDTSVTATYVLTPADIDAGTVENTASGSGIAVDDTGTPLGDPTSPGDPLVVTDTSDAGTDPDGTVVPDPDGTETPDSEEMMDDDPTNDPTVFSVPPSAMLELVKSVASITDNDANNIPSAGDIVNYTFTVTNTGNVDLVGVTVSDLLGTVSGGPIDLAIGATDSTTFTMAYEMTAADVAQGEVENTAIATGDAVDASGDPILDPSTNAPVTALDTSDAGTDPELGPDGTPVDVADPSETESGTPDGDPGNDPTILGVPAPELTVVKSVAAALDSNNDGLFGGEGDEILYTFVVTNTGNVDLVGITLTDSLAPVSGGPIDLAVGQGDGLSFTASYNVTAADLALGYIENTAVATGSAVGPDGAPLLGLDGTPITVSDTSDAGTDPDAAPIPDPSGTETPDGSGTPDGDPSNDPTVLSVPANAAPSISVIKSVASIMDNGDGLLGEGDTVTYAFTVTNTGNVSLGNVMVTDASAVVSGGPITLAVGAVDTTTFTATRVITAIEGASGAIDNSAEATGGAVNSVGDPITEPNGGPQLTASDTSDAGTEPEFGPSGTPQTIPDPESNETPDGTGTTDSDPTNDPTSLFIPMPGLQVIKSVDVVNDTNNDGLFGDAGDLIEFSFTVINTGNTDLSNIVIVDSTAVVSGGPISLAVGASDFGSFTAQYTVTAADFALGYVENTATGFGDVMGSDGNPLSNPVNPGEPLTVTDTSDAGSNPDGSPVTDPETNETPDGTNTPDGDPSNDPTVVSIPANPNPELSVIKSVAAVFDTDGDLVVGGEDDELVYQFDVTNTGSVDLVNVAVNDAQLGGLIGTIPTLDIGQTVTLTHSYIISAADQAAGLIENTASAQGAAVNIFGTPLLDPTTGDPVTAFDTSDAGTDSSLDPVTDPETTETPDQSGSLDNDPSNDPTVTLIPLAVPDTAVSGTFYLDENGDNALDGGDTPLEGIIVRIRDADGNIVATTVTDVNGFYEMTGFGIGTLDIEFVDPVTGEIVGLLTDLVFGRNTALANQNGSLVPPVSPTTLNITKTTTSSSVLIGGSVPYVITVENPQGVPISADILDQLPPGFIYTPNSATIDGVAIEPSIAGRSLTWDNISLNAGQTVVLELVVRAGPSTPTGDLVNTAQAFDPVTGAPLSPTATAVVSRTPEAVFECSDIIGKVFDDVNGNGYQDGPFMPDTIGITDQDYDAGKYGELAPVEEILEPGLPAVRLMTTTGLIITTDEYGRYNVPCAALPGAIGENFTLKLDTNSLPTGYRVTTENPRTMRLTAGIMTEMNFGASISRVVDIDLTASAFGGDHQPVAALVNGLDGLLSQVRSTPSILRISYFTNGESGAVADARLDALEEVIRDKWRGVGTYRLIIERTVTRLQ